MDPISFKEATGRISIGDDNDPERVEVPFCIALKQCSGLPFTITRYKLSPIEREDILKTGVIYIVAPGNKPNKQLVTARCPFAIHGYKPVQG